MHEIGIKYQGSYEMDFLDLCQKMGLEVKRGKRIRYKFNKKESYYFSDFYLEKYNLIIEIKSTYIYELHKKQNIAKRKAVIKNGFKFLFIIDKKYSKLLNIINKSNLINDIL